MFFIPKKHKIPWLRERLKKNRPRFPPARTPGLSCKQVDSVPLGPQDGRKLTKNIDPLAHLSHGFFRDPIGVSMNLLSFFIQTAPTIVWRNFSFIPLGLAF